MSLDMEAIRSQFAAIASSDDLADFTISHGGDLICEVAQLRAKLDAIDVIIDMSSKGAIGAPGAMCQIWEIVKDKGE